MIQCLYRIIKKHACRSEWQAIIILCSVALDGAAVVVEGPGVAGIAVGEDLEGSGIGTGKDASKVIDVPGITGIAVIENLKCRNTDIRNDDTIENHVGGSNHICKVGIGNRRHVGTRIPRRHGTHVWRRRRGRT